MDESEVEARGGDARELPEGLLERLGAALIAPRRALAGAETGGGRAPGDLALLFVLGFVALHVDRLVTAGWLVVDGEVSVAIQTVLVAASHDLSVPLMILFFAGAVLTAVAGRRRSIGADFDLVCVAFIPAVVVHLAGALIDALSIVPETALSIAVTAVAYTWTAALWVLAYLQTRTRRAT